MTGTSGRSASQALSAQAALVVRRGTAPTFHEGVLITTGANSRGTQVSLADVMGPGDCRAAGARPACIACSCQPVERAAPHWSPQVPRPSAVSEL